MRTIKMMVVVLVVASVAIIACQKEEEAVTTNPETTAVERPWNMLNYKEVIERLEYYDETRIPMYEEQLGFEDSRVHHYSIETIENYIAYVKQLSKEKGIEFTGINFVASAYPEDADYGTPKYQNIMLMPTTIIDGKQIGYDPELSTTEKIVTTKEALANYGYNWVYDSEEDYANRKNVVQKSAKEKEVLMQSAKAVPSSAGNYAGLTPPHNQ